MGWSQVTPTTCKHVPDTCVAVRSIVMNLDLTENSEHLRYVIIHTSCVLVYPPLMPIEV